MAPCDHRCFRSGYRRRRSHSRRWWPHDGRRKRVSGRHPPVVRRATALHASDQFGLSGLIGVPTGLHSAAMAYSLGIDIGGTFTDIVVYDHERGAAVQSQGAHHARRSRARRRGGGGARCSPRAASIPPAFTRVVHATTLFTNALIERQGAPTGLITTAGFADTLEIGRERKFELYDLNIEKPAPLVPRHLRLEVRERVRADGSVMQPLDRGRARRRGRAARGGRRDVAGHRVPARLRQPRPRGAAAAHRREALSRRSS